MALKNVSLFLRKSDSGKGLTLSGDEIEGFYTISIKQVKALLKVDEKEHAQFSKAVDDEEE